MNFRIPKNDFFEIYQRFVAPLTYNPCYRRQMTRGIWRKVSATRSSHNILFSMHILRTWIIVYFQENGAAFEAGGLEVGQLILEVDGQKVEGKDFVERRFYTMEGIKAVGESGASVRPSVCLAGAAPQ